MDTHGVPHPLLKEPSLFMAGAPKRITWKMIIQAFSSCGTVLSAGKYNGLRDVNTWIIRYSSILEAEMALAVLNGTAMPGVSPPFMLVLSHSPDLESALPPRRLFSQCVYTDTYEHPIRRAPARDVFHWFRHAGPLVSVRVDVDAGRGRTCIIEYWDEGHANYARFNCKTLVSTFKQMPPFSLRTINPVNLYCTGLGEDFRQENFDEFFSKFGFIAEARLLETGSKKAFGFIRFLSREAAVQAVAEMNGRPTDGSTMQVRFHEPSSQIVVALPLYGPSPPNPPSGRNAKPGMSGPGAGGAGNGRFSADGAKTGEGEATETAREDEKEGSKTQGEEAARHREEAAAQRAKDDEARRKREEALRKQSEEQARRREVEERRREEARRRREEAVNAELEAEAEGKAADSEYKDAKEHITNLAQALEVANAEVDEAYRAVAEAERMLAVARTRRATATRRADAIAVERMHAQTDLHNSLAQVQSVEARVKSARQTREAAQKAEQELDDEIRTAREDERRQHDLAESIRKMKELNESERRSEGMQQNRTWQQPEGSTSQDENWESEAARLARQHAEQEAASQRAYAEASAKERERCKQRDTAFLSTRRAFTRWVPRFGIERFNAVSVEFDEIKFSDSQPLTFESVPWPVVLWPLDLKLTAITWDAVETFFSHVKSSVGKEGHREMLEKTHRRFHPDKWRSRGLLKTVLDEELRRGLEEAGNIVAQAVTPLWLASKTKG